MCTGADIYLVLVKCELLSEVALAKNILEQAQLGEPHSRIQVELGFILQA